MRRRENAEEHAKPGLYYHTPQVAARDFANTTTPHTLKDKDIHKLSRSVLKQYKFGPEYKVPTADNLQQHGGRVIQNMDILSERNQFQRTPALESAARTDRARMGNKLISRDPQNPNASSNSNVDVLQPSRLDEGSVWEMSNIGTVLSKTIIQLPNDRNDWTQNDQCENNGKHTLKYLRGPLFRRTTKSGTYNKELGESRSDSTLKNTESNGGAHRRFGFCS